MSHAAPHIASSEVVPLLRDLMDEVRRLREEQERTQQHIRRMERQLGSQLISRAQAAERVDCSEKTIIRREKDGAITRIDVPGVGIRYPVSEVDALAESSRAA